MTYDEWISGENKQPEKIEINKFENKFITRDDKFEKKENVKAELAPPEKYKKLQDKLIELEHGIQKLEAVNMGIKKKIKDEQLEIEKLEHRITEVLTEE